jgi:hypothetical protein
VHFAVFRPMFIPVFIPVSIQCCSHFSCSLSFSNVNFIFRARCHFSRLLSFFELALIFHACCHFSRCSHFCSLSFFALTLIFRAHSHFSRSLSFFALTLVLYRGPPMKYEWYLLIPLINAILTIAKSSGLDRFWWRTGDVCQSRGLGEFLNFGVFWIKETPNEA